jgi:membrane protease YdiL (CAAX protease family)
MPAAQAGKLAVTREVAFMTSIESIFRRRPVLSYYILTFALSWGGWFLLLGGDTLPSDSTISDARFLIAVLAAPVAPAAACLLLTRVIDGRRGYETLRGHLLRWRLGARWYAAVLLPAPLVAIGTGAILAIALGNSDYLSAIFTTDSPIGLLVPGIMTGLLVGFCEELGWTGFAVPRLRASHSALATGVFVGMLWGAWHLPLFREADSFSDGISLLVLLVALFTWLPAYRILMVWVYDSTQSLFAAFLMHASLSASQVIFLPSDLSDTQSLVSMLARSCVWWLIVAAVCLAKRDRPVRETSLAGAALALREGQADSQTAGLAGR